MRVKRRNPLIPSLNIKYFLILLLCLLIRCCRCGALNSNVANPTRFNVVLVIFDDMRPAIGGYGDCLAKTPNLDAFMSESHYFTRAYSQQALCAPSRNSMLTSRRPDTLRLYDFYSYWRTFVGNFTTLPQYFMENGYYTYSIGKVFHPGVSSNNTDDFPYSWSETPFRPKSEKFMNSPVCPDANGVLRKNLICPVHLQTQPLKTLPDIESVTEAIRFLHSDCKKPKKPFFLALGFHKPHINFRFPQQFINHLNLSDFFNYTTDRSKPFDMPNVAWNPYTDVRSRDDFKLKNISFPYGPISLLQSAQIRQAYYASVAYVDDLFGKFIEHVDRSNTIVVVTSDHGWSLGEHGEWAKYSNFEVALRVPLIIRSPEFPLTTAKKIDKIAELLDIFPTIVDLAHLPAIPKCHCCLKNLTCTEGKSLYPILKGTVDEKYHYNQYAYSQYPRPGMQPTKHPNSDKPKLKNIKVMGYSIRTENFRYTLWVRFDPSNFSKDWSSVYGEEMYNHMYDAGEKKNINEMPDYQGIRLWLQQLLITGFRR